MAGKHPDSNRARVQQRPGKSLGQTVSKVNEKAEHFPCSSDCGDNSNMLMTLVVLSVCVAAAAGAYGLAKDALHGEVAH